MGFSCRADSYKIPALRQASNVVCYTMETFQDIISHFKLSETDIERLSHQAKTYSIDCGKAGVAKELDLITWDLFQDISDRIWGSELTNKQNIS